MPPFLAEVVEGTNHIHVSSECHVEDRQIYGAAAAMTGTVGDESEVKKDAFVKIRIEETSGMTSDTRTKSDASFSRVVAFFLSWAARDKLVRMSAAAMIRILFIAINCYSWYLVDCQSLVGATR